MDNQMRKDCAMSDTVNRGLILFFRLAMGWTFLYAGVSQVFEPNFTSAAFLGHTKTFHDVFAFFASPGVVPYTDFLVKYGHLLIGLSLVSGLLVRVSSVFGILLLLTYYFAHMDWPYIDSQVNFIMEYHLVYIGALVFVMAARGGEVFGLDSWLERTAWVQKHPNLRPLLG